MSVMTERERGIYNGSDKMMEINAENVPDEHITITTSVFYNFYYYFWFLFDQPICWRSLQVRPGPLKVSKRKTFDRTAG